MANSLERVIEKRFAGEVKGIMRLLREHQETAVTRVEDCKKELQTTGNPADFQKSVRSAGQTFAR